MKTLAALSLVALLAGCTKEQLSQVRDTSDKRRIICEFIDGAQGIEKAKAACAAGKSLEEVAAAYAGCEAP